MAVIFDGASKNTSMAEKLGCNIKKLEIYFSHPSKTNEKVHAIQQSCDSRMPFFASASELLVLCRDCVLF